MKQIVSNALFFENVGKPPRTPLMTFREFAYEFGVSDPVLRQALRDDGAPKPVFMHRNNNTARNSWYNPKEMRAWWSQRSQS